MIAVLRVTNCYLELPEKEDRLKRSNGVELWEMKNIVFGTRWDM